MGIWITHEIWTLGPNFIRNTCFREGPVGNSESRTGLTHNPINGVPSTPPSLAVYSAHFLFSFPPGMSHKYIFAPYPKTKSPYTPGFSLRWAYQGQMQFPAITTQHTTTLIKQQPCHLINLQRPIWTPKSPPHVSAFINSLPMNGNRRLSEI